ncbi:hypothetical protein K435DRAFT_811887 [Dendrothele bispora CBS 962.96]|uniref:MYND-type domain-containing protein n=1 Tax=Dendrothele bispora (strain CBS 962.96) TaxID=1314807 RepID=A0A4S8KR28_DENBC|nr:hypothetical protein K435DRAFT_811887 [Dendrothele bispora CBS 962.96]
MSSNRRPPVYPGAQSSKFINKDEFFSRQCFQCRSFDPNKRCKRCTRCSQAFYCSEKCQKAHWERHKPLCKPKDQLRPLLDKQLDAFLAVHLLVTLTLATHWAIHFQDRKTKYICISLTQRKGIDPETPPSRYFTLENIDFVDRHDLLLDLLRGVEEHLENVIAEDTREDVVPVILTVNDLPVKCSTISLRSIAPEFYQSLRESEKMMQTDGEYGWLNRARFVIEHGLVMRIAGQNRGDSKDLNVVSKEVLLGQRDIIEVGRLQHRRNSDNWIWVRVEQNELPAMTGCSQQFANVLIPDFSPKRHMDDFTKEFGKELSEQGMDPELMFGYMLQKLAQTQLR